MSLFSLLLLLSCTGNPATKALTDQQMQKLGPQLQGIIAGDTSDVDNLSVGIDAEGRSVYPVFLRVTDPEAFPEDRIPVNSWSGTIATARLTALQIRDAARIDGVESIRLSGRAEPFE